jgi:hypothetical protein
MDSPFLLSSDVNRKISKSAAFYLQPLLGMNDMLEFSSRKPGF